MTRADAAGASAGSRWGGSAVRTASRAPSSSSGASDEPERFAKGATVYVEREPATVVESKIAGGRVWSSGSIASARRGAELELPAAELPPAGEDAFYVYQLVGLTVEEEGGRVLGRVQDVTPGVANDVLELEGGIALPMVEDCVRTVDLEEGRIVVAPGFAPES